MKILAILLSFFCLAGAANALQPTPGLKPIDLRTAGNPSAAVKVYVFSFLTCPYCSVYHAQVLPQIDEKYVVTNKIFLTYVDAPGDGKNLTGVMLSRCVDSDKSLQFMSGLYKDQKTWAKGNTKEYFTNYSKMFGLTDAQIDKCLANKGLASTINNDRNFYMDKYGIKSFPTTVIVKGDVVKKVVGADANAIMQILEGMTNGDN